MFSSGSKWRKWDLHIHSKYSLESRAKLEVSTIFDEAIKNNIGAISITDHSNFDCLDEVWNYWETGKHKDEYIKDKIQFLPGIEMRTDSGKHSVHVIAIFPPEITIDKTKVKSDKKNLQENFLNPLKYTEAEIKASGNGDYSTGLFKKTINFFELSHLVHKLGGLVIIHAGTKTGGLEKEMKHAKTENKLELLNTLGSEKEKIIQEADICELPNWEDKCVNEMQFYLKKFNKPSIVCSDSHESYNSKKFTWIKSDLTFEGLKQIVYEPEERVKIQTDNPYADKEKVFFSNLKVDGSKNFVVPDLDNKFNRELVTIIGGRGSGKSALLESIAFLNEEHTKRDQNGKRKIIEYYRDNLGGKDPAPNFNLSIQLIDKNGNNESFSKSLDNREILGLPFLYIGQEQLSSLATNDKELTEKICDLINIDFSELEQNNLKEKTRDILTSINNLEEEIVDIYKKYPEFINGDFDIWISRYVAQREEQKNKLSSKTTKDLLEQISSSVDRGMKLRDYKTGLENILISLEDVTVNNQIIELNKIEQKLYGEKAVALPVLDFATQKTAISKQISKVDKEVASLRELYSQKRMELIKLGLKEDINVLLQAAEVIQREISLANKDKVLFIEKNKLLNSSIKIRNGLYVEVQQRLNNLKKKIDEKFAEFKKSRNDSKEDEKQLFTQVIRGIDIQGSIVFDQEVFCKYVLDNCLDRRIIKTEEDLKAMIAKKNLKGQANDLTLDSIKKWIETDLMALVKSDMLNARGAQNLISYLFMNWDEFIAVRTIVSLNGIPTDRLSVGQRGTLLLKIYLATATAKQIFIVDQPEDNLDNSFIMNELVPLIRQVKKIRQIIISTHNANLVVNADSEQVIVAQLDNKGDYISGSIENPTINNLIKEILEGGEEAFRSRENKYGMRSLNAN